MLRSFKPRTVPRANYPGIARLLIAAAIFYGSAALHAAHADNTVLDWNNEFLLITQQTSGNLVAGPPEVAREIAQIGEAMSDAVSATGADPAAASAAAGAAAYTALTNVFTDAAWQTPISAINGNFTASNGSSNVNLANNVILPELKNFLTGEFGFDPTAGCGVAPSCAGYSIGVAAANTVDSAPSTSPAASGAVAAIQNGLLSNAPAGSGVTPGVYVPPTAAGGRPEMFPAWGSVAPTGLTSTQVAAAKALANGPPPLNSAAYANALLQTECQGSSAGQANLPGNLPTTCAAAGFGQTAAQAKADSTAALFWNDPGTTTQPPGHWLQIANTAMASQGTSLLKSAQLTALLGESMNDAGIAAWGAKYTYNLWRPVTAIRDCASSGNGVTWVNPNCDATWSSLIATPPHPDYLAGHPAFSGAAATVLADFFGSDNIGFTSTSNYYCNGGTANVNAANQVISCTLSGTTYYICSATTTPEFNGTQPVDCTDGTTTSALTGSDCNTVTSNGVNNRSPLICAITETYSSFSEASSGELGAEFSRVVGGIHTPFAVEDALTVGNGIGQEIAANADLPDVLPEPSSLSVGAMSFLVLGRLRRRRGLACPNAQ